MSEDLISRAAVVKMLHEKAENYRPSMFTTESEFYIAKIVAVEALQKVLHMESIDATVNRYGEWELIFEDADMDKLLAIECSACKTRAKIKFARITSYCPYCGAKMTGEDDWLSSKSVASQSKEETTNDAE